MFSFNDVVIWKAIKGRLARKKILFEPNGFTWLLRIIFNSSLLLFEVVAIAYIINISASSPHIYNSVEDIKADHLTLLVLGTSKKIQGTEVINVYFTQRINETIDAYKSGKVDRIILSGDRNGSGYDETKDMMTALVAAGVPKSVITLDPSGFRTFDSIKRLEIPVNETVVIVSQTFHLERALYLARSEGLMAVGLAADGNMTTKMFKRELLAKTKVLLDIYVLNTQSNGIAAKPRRQVEWTKTTDIILMLFVLICVAVAGQLSKNLLTY